MSKPVEELWGGYEDDVGLEEDDNKPSPQELKGEEGPHWLWSLTPAEEAPDDAIVYHPGLPSEVKPLGRSEPETPSPTSLLEPHQFAADLLRHLSTAFEKAVEANGTAGRPDGEVPRETVIDQNNVPMPRDVYLRLARELAFPSAKVGKRVLAKWGDVLDAVEARTRKTSKPTSNEDMDTLRDRMGLARKGTK